jgi:hypothetical protein
MVELAIFHIALCSTIAAEAAFANAEQAEEFIALRLQV